MSVLDRVLIQTIRAPVRRTLAQWYDRDAAVALIDRAIVISEEERQSLPEQPSFGGTLMVRMASLTRGLYTALTEIGADPADAIERTAAATWSIYRHMGRVPGALSWAAAAFSTDPAARIRAATKLFRLFPFGPPSYIMVDVPANPCTVAFDVQRCPVSEYFRESRLNELCGAAWCDLDYQLAPMWGSRLERTTTLAGGSPRCDFRWHTVAGSSGPK